MLTSSALARALVSVILPSTPTMGLFTDFGNFISLKTSQMLDLALPGRADARLARTVGAGVAGSNGQRALPPSPTSAHLSGPYGASSQAKPNIQVINDWIVPSTLGWTLEAMQSAILQLENGNMFAAHSLMLAMTRDATIGQGLMNRRMSLAALDKELWFPPEIPEEAREALRKHWNEAITAQDKATAHSYTVMLGLAPMTQTWFEKTEETGETFWQFRSEVLETGHMQYRPDLRKYYFVARDGYREVIDDGNAWALFKSLGDRRHHLDSAVRTLATLWFIVQEAVRYHRAYNAEYGRPIKALMVPDTHRLTEDVSQLVQQASGLYGGSVILLPQFGEGQGQANFDLKLIEAKSRGYATFLDLAKVARDLITLYLVGVLDTTQSGAGSHGKATTQLRVADRYTTGDARVEEDALNRPLRKWADFNAFKRAPEWRINTSPAADEAAAAEVAQKKASALKSTVDALKGMYDMGVRITEDRITSTLGQIGLKWTDRGAAEALSPYLHTSSAGMERAGNSVLVCWEVPVVIGKLLRVPGGEDIAELHLTLALCPEASLPDVLAGMVAVIGELEAVNGYITGVASWPANGPDIQVSSAEATLPERMPVAEAKTVEDSEVTEEEGEEGLEEFEEESEETSTQGAKSEKTELVEVVGKSALKASPSIGQLAYVSLVDAPSLAIMRDKVVKALEAANVKIADNHGFIPHITRAYLPAGSGVEAPSAPIPMAVDKLSVWAMGGRVRIPMRVGRLEDQESDNDSEGSDFALCADSDLEAEIVELSELIKQGAEHPQIIELRTYKRRNDGKFGSGVGNVAKPKAERVTGKKAAAHSERAHAEKTVESHRYAARAHVAVARREIAKGNVDKAKQHIETAKAHRDEAGKIKAGGKTAGKPAVQATPVTKPVAAKPVATPAKSATEFKPTTVKAASAEKWGAKHYGEWAKNLSQSEKDAAHAYASADFQQMNGGLRANKGLTGVTGDLLYNKGTTRNAIVNLDKAIAKSPGTPHDMVVYRRMITTKSDPKGLDISQWKPGSNFTDHGFMSTNVGEFSGRSDAMLHIKVPKGTKAAYLDSSTLAYSGSHELLLPRGTKLRIDKVAKGGRVIHASIVPE